MLMSNPYSLKPVDVPDALIDRFREAGFSEKEPEVVAEVEKPAAPSRKRRMSRS